MHAPYTVFVADLHLSDNTPELTTAFFRFLHRHRRADALYILGDLFEAWTGDDTADDAAIALARVLREYARRVPVYFQCGNRDFLLGEDYARRAGMRLLPETDTVTLYGRRYLICHGDQLCGRDAAYLRYRRIVRHPFTRRLAAALPAALRRRIAAALRRASRQKRRQKDYPAVSDVSADSVQTALAASPDAAALIHGHTHRPAVHRHTAGGRRIARYVLPDWYGRNGGYLYVSARGARLRRWQAA